MRYALRALRIMTKCLTNQRLFLYLPVNLYESNSLGDDDL
jgi:hypothetical protein